MKMVCFDRQNFMIITDLVYGQFEVNEPVLLDLISSPELQRLKGVDQAGYWGTTFETRNNRFNHSVGVMLVLRKFGATLEEQISGLIHDVSHTAFSHAADYVFKDAGAHQDFQDSIHEDYVKNSSIAKVLSHHKIDCVFILDDSNFPLKENDLPNICADRIDYSLRDAFAHKYITTKDVNYVLNNLVVIDNNWVFKNQESAQFFANVFRKMNNDYWSGELTGRMFFALSEYLLYALKSNYVSRKDFFETDEFVLSKIAGYHKNDEGLQKRWYFMEHQDKLLIDSSGRKIVSKSRVIDPLILDNGKLMKLSEKNLEWKDVLREESKAKEYYLKF